TGMKAPRRGVSSSAPRLDRQGAEPPRGPGAESEEEPLSSRQPSGSSGAPVRAEGVQAAVSPSLPSAAVLQRRVQCCGGALAEEACPREAPPQRQGQGGAPP